MLRVISGAGFGALEWRIIEDRVILMGQTSDTNRSVQLLEERVGLKRYDASVDTYQSNTE